MHGIEAPSMFGEIAADTLYQIALYGAGGIVCCFLAVRDAREGVNDLRHSAASYLAMNGATPGEIAAVLGHKTLAMVKRYAHLSDDHVTSVVERMNKRIFEA